MTLFLETLQPAARRARREHDLRRLEHVVRAARAAHTLGAAFLAVAQSHGLTSAIMDARRAGDGRGGARDRLPARPRRVGRDAGSPLPREAGGGRRRERARADRARGRRTRTGSGCASQQADGAVKEARVPAGTTLFDAASWNGVAIDSTCGGHGTCKKCKVRVVSGERADLARRPARVLAGGAEGRLAARLPRAGAGGPPRRGAAAADAPEGRARRRRPARDPAAGGAEALPRARRADARGPDAPTSSACSRRWTTSSCACRSTSLRALGGTLRDVGLEGDGRARRRRADRRRARRHDRGAATRSRSTSARRRSSRRCSTSRPGQPRGGAARC